MSGSTRARAQTARVREDTTDGARRGSATPTVAIADDHPPIRFGVRMALMEGGFRVVAEAADADGAVEAVLRERPDVCLLDVKMPGGGIEAATRLATLAPGTAVVMLTVSGSADDLLAALRAGARGYLPKDMSPTRLPAALHGVLRGEAALPRTFVGRMLHELRTLPDRDPAPLRVGAVELTPRESEILRLLRTGLSTMEIGRQLSLSPVTVRRHISAAGAKLGAVGRDEALRAIA
ncbi:MAG TPA: response regulator transcription factor [Solirubrobacteraceae bacterium]|nr:response regulator transcription factor [Solirubrobacteraceae bacterium]